MQGVSTAAAPSRQHPCTDPTADMPKKRHLTACIRGYLPTFAARMNLVADIGNSSVKAYLFEGDTLLAQRHEAGHTLLFLSQMHSFVAEAAAAMHAHGNGGTAEVEAAVVSSVVDMPAHATAMLSRLGVPLLHFTALTPTPLTIAYDTPHTLGSDRVAAALGAWAQKPGRPLLIVDAGSCITFDRVTADGTYLGGNIAPGLQARLRAIGDYFPRLPHVEAEGEAPEVGHDTPTAIRAGAVTGMRHEIEGYICHHQAAEPGLCVFLTGGDANHFAIAEKSNIFADPLLVPRGLNYALTHQQRRRHAPNNNDTCNPAYAPS